MRRLRTRTISGGSLADRSCCIRLAGTIPYTRAYAVSHTQPDAKSNTGTNPNSHGGGYPRQNRVDDTGRKSGGGLYGASP